MAVDPVSSVALEKTLLRSMIAASPTFQARVGITDPAAAQARVYLDDLAIDPAIFGDLQGTDDAQRLKRPYAVVVRPQGLLYDLFAAGDQNYLRRRGALWVYLTDNGRYDDRTQDAISFDNFAGGVADDLRDAAGVDTNLSITRIGFRLPPRKTAPERVASEGMWWNTVLEIDWE